MGVTLDGSDEDSVICMLRKIFSESVYILTLLAFIIRNTCSQLTVASRFNTEFWGLVIVVLLTIPQLADAAPPIANTTTNPLATAEQLDSERAAIELVKSPEVARAKAQLKAMWLAAASVRGDLSPEFLHSPQTLADLQLAADEVAFFSAMSATNGDPSRPKVVMTSSPPHRWFGLDVPGSRLLDDNPDTIYRTFRVDPNATYVLTGRFGGLRPADFTISVYDKRSVAVSYLGGKDIKVGPDGTFAITLVAGSNDPGGNRIELVRGAVSVVIRDTINRWGEQKITALQVKRVEAPALPPKTQPEMIAATVANILKLGGAFSDGPTSLFAHHPVNTVTQISSAATEGRLVSQAASKIAFELEDDEALVFTVDVGGAEYFGLPVCTHWMTTTDVAEHTQSLNNSQAQANPDGTYTFVLSPTDPGVYNWIDTAGLHQGQVFMRWQALPPGGGKPAVSAKVFKLTDLPAVLPKGTRFVTAIEREAQRRERRFNFMTRYEP